jgi:hypothetical protein
VEYTCDVKTAACRLLSKFRFSSLSLDNVLMSLKHARGVLIFRITLQER